jgi:hypothetical protein
MSSEADLAGEVPILKARIAELEAEIFRWKEALSEEMRQRELDKIEKIQENK